MRRVDQEGKPIRHGWRYIYLPTSGHPYKRPIHGTIYWESHDLIYIFHPDDSVNLCQEAVNFHILSNRLWAVGYIREPKERKPRSGKTLLEVFEKEIKDEREAAGTGGGESEWWLHV